MSESEIDRAYSETSFEMVCTGADNKYEIPVSEAAKFRLSKRVGAAEFRSAFERGDYAFIAPFTQEGYLSSKILDSETNEFFHVKLRGDVLRVFPKDEEFSKATLERAVHRVRQELAEPELEVSD